MLEVLTAEIADKLFDALIANGFYGGFDCSVGPCHGYFERGKKAGMPRKSDDEWWVKITIVEEDDIPRLREAVRGFFFTREDVHWDRGTYTLTGPSWGVKTVSAAR